MKIYYLEFNGDIMKQDMIVIIDLGSEENAKLARDIRSLGVYSEIHNFDITEDELNGLPNVKGIILNGGPNNIVDGVKIDASQAVYKSGNPLMIVNHDGTEGYTLEGLEEFLFDVCKAEKNWNMKNFINDQIELIRNEVKDKIWVALAKIGVTFEKSYRDRFIGDGFNAGQEEYWKLFV